MPGCLVKRLWKSDMCRADLWTDNPLFFFFFVSLPPSPPYIPEKTHPLARGKIYVWKKKKNPNLEPVYAHPCVIIYFQCRVPGISTLEKGVEIESFSAVLWGQVLFGKKPSDLSVIEGAFKWNNCLQRGKRKTRSSERNSWFSSATRFSIRDLPSCLFQSLTPLCVYLCFSLTLSHLSSYWLSLTSSIVFYEFSNYSATSFLTRSFCCALQHIFKPD